MPVIIDPTPDQPYFTVEEFRARYPEITEAKYSDERVEEYRDLAEEAIEQACGVAFTPRTASLTTSGIGSTLLDFGRPQLRSVTSATSSGDTLTLTDLAIVEPSSAYLPGTWPSGVGNLEITIEHGYTIPPLRIKQAAMILTKEWMVKGPISERATQLGLEDGNVVNLATPGVQGSLFGIPEVAAAVRAYRWPTSQIGTVSLAPARYALTADLDD